MENRLRGLMVALLLTAGCGDLDFSGLFCAGFIGALGGTGPSRTIAPDEGEISLAVACDAEDCPLVEGTSYLAGFLMDDQLLLGNVDEVDNIVAYEPELATILWSAGDVVGHSTRQQEAACGQLGIFAHAPGTAHFALFRGETRVGRLTVEIVAAAE